MESLEGLSGMTSHAMGIDGMDSFDVPGIAGNLLQLQESIDEPTHHGGLPQHHGLHMHYPFHIDSEHLQHHSLMHDPIHMQYGQQVMQPEEKQDTVVMLPYDHRQHSYAPQYMHSAMGGYQIMQHQQPQPQQLPSLSGDETEEIPEGSDRRARNQGSKTRKSYSIEFKMNAIQIFDRVQSISPAAAQLGLPKKGGRKMLRDWVKNREKIFASYQSTEEGKPQQKSLRKLHPGKKPVLSNEQELRIHEWYKTERDSGRVVSNSELTMKAREIAKDEKFKASSRWLMRFKRKLGLQAPPGKQDRKRPRTDTSVDLGLDSSNGEYGDESDPTQAMILLHSHQLLGGHDMDAGLHPSMVGHLSDSNMYMPMPQHSFAADELQLHQSYMNSSPMMNDYRQYQPAPVHSPSMENEHKAAQMNAQFYHQQFLQQHQMQQHHPQQPQFQQLQHQPLQPLLQQPQVQLQQQSSPQPQAQQQILVPQSHIKAVVV